MRSLTTTTTTLIFALLTTLTLTAPLPQGEMATPCDSSLPNDVRAKCLAGGPESMDAPPALAPPPPPQPSDPISKCYHTAFDQHQEYTPEQKAKVVAVCTMALADAH